ncbi:TetR/AcrR family transcriptional regulator [Sphingomonas crusticola]|uniref:TetR/AcrR family transcriptional regulator n=1 Tax=Sphingomonas crusticola TaxID=1697973 RepID=UPI000E234954|nr:TetR/AcrR family transcriptional regulator [Sphingomonas crusticola]
MPKRPPEHMEAQRERILRAALRCISDLGIERASIAEIRKQAGLSAGALYTHFANKDAIVAAALRFASVKEAYLPETWPEFAAAVASMAGDDGFDAATVARMQLQVYAAGIRPGAQHDLLRPIIAGALDLVVSHLSAMEREGRVRLRMSPLKTALAIGAIRDGIVWSGLALDRAFDEIEADIVAAISCLTEPLLTD